MGKDESRWKIIEAAIQLANGMRLDQIGVEALALHGGVSEEEVRQIFPDCRALSLGIFQWAAHNLMAQVEYAALRNKPPLEVLEDVFHSHVVFLVSHAALPPLLLEALAIPGDGAALRQRIAKLLEDYEANLALLLHLALKEATVRPDLDPALAAKLLTYLTQGLALRGIAWGAADVLLQEERKIWQQYLNGIRA
ncbi:MAG: hypothetical protein C3F18_07850 [Nitrosomonadales bacterium]|nr:MAG: hypothetical protein C3F18_07850 [Nitrosomonadales bacterium]